MVGLGRQQRRDAETTSVKKNKQDLESEEVRERRREGGRVLRLQLVQRQQKCT